ncbi:helix-turn-helix domain-containing protein [Burkholderia ambifaria]|uniref:helix-turn-helix domain-containing protein n=1 Tax=Burkholderia ambifaria TaxID=152480 RepID=UPI001FC87FFA|nr:helix-turn-helix domain-containing protein [Burkholderia ambifaria]
MAATERITMTMRELDRFKVIQDVADGKLKPSRAAERLELTARQVRWLVVRLREHGPAGVVSGHRTKPGNRRLDPGAADRALSIIRDRYADFGPTLACEKLWEYPDGRIEIRADGRVLPYRQYERLAAIDQGAVVEHKRSSHVPQVAQALQAQRDNSRIGNAPSRTHRGDSTRTDRNEPEAGEKKQHEITLADVEHVIVDLTQRRQTAKPVNKPGPGAAKTGETNVSALPVQAPTLNHWVRSIAALSGRLHGRRPSIKFRLATDSTVRTRR